LGFVARQDFKGFQEITAPTQKNSALAQKIAALAPAISPGLQENAASMHIFSPWK
jgi:hypothetical protein